MNNFDEVTKENKQEVNPQRLQIPDHPCSILIVDGSGSEKTNALFNLTNHQLDIDKIFLYVKDPQKPKYEYLIRKWQKVSENFFKDTKPFNEYSNDINNVLNNKIQKRKETFW